MPLSIELAAARLGSMGLQQIEESLQARFRLLSGGPDIALSRQQTVYASLDWAHTLLTGPERALFRRLAVFVGGFDMDAARSVNGDDDPEGSQLREMIEVLVGTFLLTVEDAEGAVRYRLSETIRQYALEKLSSSGEADEVRSRHRDYYTTAAGCVEAIEPTAYGRLTRWSETEADNLRAAYAWSREQGDVEAASRLVSSLRRFVQPARVQARKSTLQRESISDSTV
jgi:predicted ATPase